MTVGIIGLGLIGGSFAKAYSQEGHTVLATDTDQSTLDFAMLSGAVSGKLIPENVGRCDLVLIAITPEAACHALNEFAPHFGSRPVVIDCCGTKRRVCKVGFSLAQRWNFTYLGGHPMAGTHQSGFKYASPTLYKGAPMVIVPPVYDDITLLDRVKELLQPAHFGRISVTTAQEHDEIIAFTSQMAHVISNAYIKSPTARKRKGFSAGSYRDLTRVAWLNPPMWAELFLENRDNLLRELDQLIDSLEEYREAMKTDDKERLTRLLDDGRRIKQEVDGR